MNMSVYLKDDLASKLEKLVRVMGISKSAFISKAVQKLIEEEGAKQPKQKWSPKMMAFLTAAPVNDPDFPNFEDRSDLKPIDESKYDDMFK